MRSRVVRVDGQDLANQELCAHTVLGHRLVGVKRFRLHVVGILDDQPLERALEFLRAASPSTPSSYCTSHASM